MPAMPRIVVSILQVTKLVLTEWRSGSKYFDLSALLFLFIPTDFGNKFAVFEISIYYTVPYHAQMQQMQCKLVPHILYRVNRILHM